MGQLVINYPDANAVHIYTALASWLSVKLTKWDAATQQEIPKTNAEVKQDVDAALKNFLRERVKQHHRLVDLKRKQDEFLANYTEAEIT